MEAAPIFLVEPWHWLVLGLVLLVAELASGTTQLLWAALAAWLTGLVFLLVPLGLPAQLLIFGAATLALTWFGRGRLKRGLLARMAAARTLNAPEHDLVGRTAVAEGDFVDGEGRVRLGDTVWRARADCAIMLGDSLTVAEVDGATLIVRLRR